MDSRYRSVTTCADLQRRRLVALGAASLAGPTALARPAPLRFGLTPVFLDDRIGLLARWKAYLTDAVGEVEFIQRQTYAQIIDTLRTGLTDFAWICGYPYVLHERELRLVCVPRWRGHPTYRSYLIVPVDSPARQLEDLAGRNFAFSDPLSNSGFLYPQHLLRGLGTDPGRFFARSFFTYSHRHVVEAVAERLADGGAVDGYVWETLVRVSPRLTAGTRVVHRSPEFGFPPIVAGPKARGDALRSFREALLAMHADARGRAVLQELQLDAFAVEPESLFESIALMARAAR